MCIRVAPSLPSVSQGVYAHVAVLRPAQWRYYAEAFASDVRLFSNCGSNLGICVQQSKGAMAS